MQGTISAQIAIVPPDIPYSHGGFELDLHRHLGLPPASVRKMNGDFTDLTLHQVRDVRHLYQKDVPV